MSITEDQANVLFSTVIREDFLSTIVIFQNVKAVTQKLSELGTASGDLVTARRYYGMYIVLIDMLLYCEDQFESIINGKWYPEVKKIAFAAAQSLNEAQAALQRRSNFTEAQIRAWESNVKSNTLTMKACEQYVRLLEQQIESIRKCRDQIAHDREVALNTYKTVEHASGLSAMISSSLNMMDALGSMQIPEIVPFSSSELQKGFDEITKRIK